jgi:hypothetical protein
MDGGEVEAMTRVRPEELLGGYATGTLTEAEKAVLFQAALRDQALFDALLEEEGLRDLLADPGARQRLLAATRPLWRRPALLASAAGLFLTLTTSLYLGRDRPAGQVQPAPAALEPRNLPSVAEPPPPATSPAGGVRAPRKPPPAPVLAPPPPPEIILQAAPRTLKKAVAPGPATAGAGVPMALTERKAENVAVRGRAGGAVENRLAEAAAPKMDALKVAPAPSRLAVATPAVPEVRLVRLPSGQARVEASHPGEGAFYLLLRTATGTVLLPGTRQTSPDGLTRWFFTFALSEDDHLDAFLLAKPVADPVRLPAEGPVEGYRKRVR